MAVVTLADTVIGMITAGLPAGVPVYDNAVPDDGVEGEPPARYVVLWMPNPTRGTEGVDGQSTDRFTRFQATSVAPDRGMAAWLSDAVTDALTDATPVVEGWGCGPVQHVMSFIPDAEEMVLSRKRVSIMDRFELLAEHVGVGS